MFKPLLWGKSRIITPTSALSPLFKIPSVNMRSHTRRELWWIQFSVLQLPQYPVHLQLTALCRFMGVSPAKFHTVTPHYSQLPSRRENEYNLLWFVDIHNDIIAYEPSLWILESKAKDIKVCVCVFTWRVAWLFALLRYLKKRTWKHAVLFCQQLRGVETHKSDVFIQIH